MAERGIEQFSFLISQIALAGRTFHFQGVVEKLRRALAQHATTHTRLMPASYPSHAGIIPDHPGQRRRQEPGPPGNWLDALGGAETDEDALR
ncbi:MAG: hypothetical protein WBH99_11575 [Azovibrio sp.]|uniref:hypothetical protein n=1 Tax=Azovibrio sp. TaxID=1872673 RepID=UPI003C77A65E